MAWYLTTGPVARATRFGANMASQVADHSLILSSVVQWQCFKTDIEI